MCKFDSKPSFMDLPQKITSLSQLEANLQENINTKHLNFNNFLLLHISFIFVLMTTYFKSKASILQRKSR